MSETISEEGTSAQAPERRERDRSSRRSSPAISPPLLSSGRPSISRAPASNPSLNTLPPLVTTAASRRTSSTRIPSYANKRLSTFSTTSGPPPRSRPGSVVFPIFHSSLPYALVRDFAYDPNHMLHYGPPPEPLSAAFTTVSDFPRRLSDPPVIPSQSSRNSWSGHPGGVDSELFAGPQLPSTSFSDGPPWREDDDLLSPIVSTRHRKGRSDVDYFSSRQDATGMDKQKASYAGTNHDGSHNYYVENADEVVPDGPGGDIVAYPNTALQHAHNHPSRDHAEIDGEHAHAEGAYDDDEENRFSRDYSFSIASPDEEMHGKALALFDFASENDNELPLKEGQVIWVSYRHGEGWLVAKDPTTGEDGLVPESYVRLERDIPGGFGSLNAQIMSDATSPVGPDTPIAGPSGLERVDSSDLHAHSQYPMVSHFTTSSKDLLPHDKHTHTPISSSASPSRQLDAQLDAVSLNDPNQTPTSQASTNGQMIKG